MDCNQNFDDAAYLQSYVLRKYPPMKHIDGSKFTETFRDSNTKHQAAIYAIMKCYDNGINKDIMDTLESIRNDYQIDELFSRQPLNKHNFNIAYKVIDDLIRELKERRGEYDES